MNYTLNQLQVYLKITETESITKAANVLHLTQPAVSIQLKNFQNQFDIPLTEIIGRKLYVTDFGKEVAESCKRILQEVQLLSYEMAKYKGNLTGKLRLSVVSTGKYVIPYFLDEFMKSHPALELQKDVTNKQQVIDALAQNKVDFAMVSIIPSELNVESFPLLKNQLFLVGKNGIKHQNRQLPIHKHQHISRYILREKGSGTRGLMEQFLFKELLELPSTPIELTSNEAVKQAVIAGLGYSIMPLIGIRNELALGQISIIPTKGLPITTEWQLIWLKNKRFSPAAKSFLEYIQNNTSTLVQKHFDWYESFVSSTAK
jgi:DNA-binding transcriptional LysR family regulator